MKKLLVLALVVCCSCSYSFDSWAQMQDEGTTITTETNSEIQGDMEKVTTTTTTVVIENENTGAILSSESTGIVAEKYEGDMDQDWGGQGSINSHTTCNNKLGVYTGSNTCASSRLDSLTTWNQTVDLNQFSIDDGGQVRWEMRFGMEPSMYNDASKNAYVELKGYDNGAVQWTDTYNVDKSTFSLNANGNYLGPNGFIYSNLDYAGGLDSLYINIGGYGEYMFDSVWFDIYHNQITTTVAESIVYNLIEQEIQNTANNIIDTTYDYSSNDISNNNLPDMPDNINDEYSSSTDNTDNNTSADNYNDTAVSPSTITVFSNIETSSPTTPDAVTNSDTGANVDQMFSNITMDIDPEEVSNIQVMVADLNSVDTDATQGTTTQNTDTDIVPIEMSADNNDNTESTIMVLPEPTTETTNEIENPPPVEDAPPESEVTNEAPNNDNLQATTTEKSTTTEAKVENESTSEVDSAENQSENETKNVEVKATEETKEIEETKEVAENNTEPEEVKEDAQEESKPEEKTTATNESEEKEEVKEEIKEEAKEEKVAEKKQKEEPKEAKEEEKEEKEVAKTEVKEEPKEEKTTKQKKEEAKQATKENKAKKIMANFENTYDALAQITQLALVNALGPNISTYNNQQIEQPLTWYEPEDIYTGNDYPDVLGNYFGVRDSLVYEKMIGEQYAK